jgi:hypothetical protein
MTNKVRHRLWSVRKKSRTSVRDSKRSCGQNVWAKDLRMKRLHGIVFPWRKDVLMSKVLRYTDRLVKPGLVRAGTWLRLPFIAFELLTFDLVFLRERFQILHVLLSFQ